MRVLLAAVFVVLSGSLLDAAPAPQAAQGPVAPAPQPLSAAATAQITALLAEKAARTPAQQKMNSQLIYAAKMAGGQLIAAGASALNSTLQVTLPRTDDGRVRLEIRANVSDGLLSQLQALGAEIVSTSVEYRNVLANVALAQVEKIAALPDVIFVMPLSEYTTAMRSPNGGPFDWDEWNRAWHAHTRLGPSGLVDRVERALAGGRAMDAGSGIFEGDLTHNAKKARDVFDVSGLNVKVCVLSDGVNNLKQAQDAGDLPKNITVLAGQAGAGNEGIAMLEIIHELAPQAQLYFATAIPNQEQYAQNIKSLRATYGCQILVDDLNYDKESPFQDGQDPGVYGPGGQLTSTSNGGIVTQAVKDVVLNRDSNGIPVANGPLYISAAGNIGNKDAGTSGVWEGSFLDGGAVNFSGPLAVDNGLGRVHDFGGQTYASVAISGTPSAKKVTLFWSDPLGGYPTTNFGREADYDLFLLDTSDNVIAASTDRQTGRQDPYEVITVPASSANTGRLAVVMYTGDIHNPDPSVHPQCVLVPPPVGGVQPPVDFTRCPRYLHLDVNQASAGLNPSTSGSIRGHAGANDQRVWAIAATPASSWGSNKGPYPDSFNPDNTVESISSDGERRYYSDATGNGSGIPSADSPIVLPGSPTPWGKPTFTAADGVSVSSSSGFGEGPQHVFFGTSAAAAHVAGIMALVEEEFQQNHFVACDQPGCQTLWVAMLRHGPINIMGTDADATPNINETVFIGKSAGARWNHNAGWGILMADQAVCAVSAGGLIGLGCPPVITENPESQTIPAKSTTNMEVVANGNGPLKYQWYVGPRGTTTHPLVGETSSSVVVFASWGFTQFWVRVTDANGLFTDSATATLTVQCSTQGNLAALGFGNSTRHKAVGVTSADCAAGPMSLDKTSLSFAATTTGAAFTSATGAQAVRLVQSGTGTVTWTATSSAPWLVVSPASGSGSATLNVSVQFVPGLSTAQSGTISVAVTGASSTVGPIAVSFSVVPNGTSTPPFGSFDTPTDGVTGVAGSIAVTGWTLDDVGVTRVTICRDAVAGETAPADPNCAGNAKIYVGDAVFIDGARTDVQGVNPTLPLNSRGGWGYLLLTNFLPGLGNGTFTLRAYAFDADGHSTALGSKVITCSNSGSAAPFGAIDVPAQGAVVSGAAFGVVGWVLAPSPARADPPGGGGVHMWVDGTDLGAINPGLWNARPDLQALFPVSGFPGVNTALGVHSFDTTTLTNGVHSIFWLATGTGSSGTSGIGSRFITVSNGSLVEAPDGAAASAGRAVVIPAATHIEIPAAAAARLTSPAALANAVEAARLDPGAIQARRGFDLSRPLQTYAPSSARIDVTAEELDRIELHLSAIANQQYSGHLQTPAGLRPLPVGSTLDASTGVFTWMPGVGFFGSYDLTFVRWSNGEAVARQDVRITLNAKGSNRVGPQTIVDVPDAGRIFRPGEAFFVGGWAADLDSPVDTGVNTVHVWAYPIDTSGGGPIFLGPAIYGGARPDVAAVYGDRFANSGYGIIVSALPPGTYDIAVFAYSTVAGNFSPARVVRVIVR